MITSVMINISHTRNLCGVLQLVDHHSPTSLHREKLYLPLNVSLIIAYSNNSLAAVMTTY